MTIYLTWNALKQFLYLFTHTCMLHFSQSIREYDTTQSLHLRFLERTGQWPIISKRMSITFLGCPLPFLVWRRRLNRGRPATLPYICCSCLEKCLCNLHSEFHKWLMLYAILRVVSSVEKPGVDNANVNDVDHDAKIVPSTSYASPVELHQHVA